MDEKIWTVESQGDVTILNMSLDTVTSEYERELCSSFSNLLKQGNRKIVIDLSNTSYLASMGIGFLIFILKNTKKSDCNLVITGCDEQVMRILKTAGVDILFDIVNDRQEAINQVS